MKLAIVGVFFDGYKDLWEDFVYLLEKNWPDNPFDVYIVNNEFNSSESPFKSIKFINAGVDAEYSKKVQTAINCLSEYDYFLLLLDDFFVYKKIDTKRIEEILTFIEKQSLDYYSMPISNFISNREKKKCRHEKKNVFQVPTNQPYLVSCQPAVWKKDFLDFCIGSENYNAWIFEGIYHNSTVLRQEKFLKGCLIDYSNPLNLLHGAVHGCLVRKTVKELKRTGYVLKTKRKMFSIPKTIFNRIKAIGASILDALHLDFIKNRLNKKSSLNKFKDEINYHSSLILTKERIDSYYKD